EDFGDRGFVHAVAGVVDFEADVFAGGEQVGGGREHIDVLGIDVLHGGADEQDAIFLADAFGAVDDQVHGGLLDLTGSGFDGGKIFGELHAELDVFGDGRLDESADFADELRHVDGLHDEAAFAGVGEQLAGEVGGMVGGFEDVLEQLAV